jgi:hypothetical protein
MDSSRTLFLPSGSALILIQIQKTIPSTSVADPGHFGTDPDPAIFASDLQDGNKKLFICLLLFEATFTSFFFKDKK